MTKTNAKTASARPQGDCVVVDTSERRCVYMASPMRGMAPPVDRANAYLRALEAAGYVVAAYAQPSR